MSNLKDELKFYESEHNYYYNRLLELNKQLSEGVISRDEWVIETNKLTTNTMNKYDDILSHILNGYKEF